MTLPKAVRLNNPVNIEYDPSNQWNGAVPESIRLIFDRRFEMFYTPIAGYRAAAKLLRNYQQFYGLNTIEELLSRFAPASDNPHLPAYIENVSAWTGVPANQAYPLDDDQALAKLLAAMHRQEAGGVYYDESVALAGVKVA